MKPLILLLLTTLCLLASNAILKLDTGGHQETIRDIIITRDKKMISCSHDTTIRIWNTNTGKEERKILGQINADGLGRIYTIALSPDEKVLAVGGNFPMRLYDYPSGKLIQVLKSHTKAIDDLSFDQNGKLYSASADSTVKIWEKQNGLYILRSTFNTHSDRVLAVKALENSSYFVSAGIDKVINLYDGNKVVASYAHTEKLRSIAISSRFIAVSGFDKDILIFDTQLNLLSTIKSSTIPSGLAFSPDGTKLMAGTTSSPLKIIIYDMTDNFKILSSYDKFTNSSIAVAFINNNTVVSGGGRNHTLAIWDVFTTEEKLNIQGEGKSIFRVGINNNIVGFGNSWKYKSKNEYGPIEKAFDLNLMNYVSFNESLFSVINSTGLSHEADNTYGDYKDATLVLPNGNKITRGMGDGLGHFTYGRVGEYILSGGQNGKLIAYDISGNPVTYFVGQGGNIKNIAVNGDTMISGGDDQILYLWDLKQIGKLKIIYPKLFLFFGADSEWVAWTKEGFFNASANGAKYIGYHINQGPNKEAQYVSVDKLYNAFYRPDLVQKALNGESLEAYAKEVNIDKLLQGGLAPKVEILTQSGKSNARDVELKLKVCENGGGYDNMTLFLNGMSVDVLSTDRALKAKNLTKTAECIQFSKLISLGLGDNTIGFRATNKTGTIESDTATINLSYKNAITAKPNLYVLSLAVDKYRDGDLKLKYSAADGDAIAKAFKTSAKDLFGQTFVYNLRDDQVTKDGIQKIFEEVGAKTTRDDVFIFHLAGHGITDPKSGEYFYLPYDFRYKNENSIREAGFSQRDFTLALSKIQALKSLSLLDTCNSGSFAEALASRGVLQKTAIDKLTRATGRATIVASSKDQVALEGFDGHGVFTYTLIEALNGKGYGNDNKITIKELATYVEEVLPDRTYKKWGYEQVPQSNITGNDFPIGVK